MSAAQYTQFNPIDVGTTPTNAVLSNPVYSGSLKSKNEDAYFKTIATMGRDEILAKSKIGIADGQFLSVTDSVFVPAGMKKIRNLVPEFVDKSPTTGSQPQFGQPIVFQIGKDAMTTTSAVTLVFEIPSFTSTRDTDGEVHYKWRDWLGLHLCGARGLLVVYVIFWSNLFN